MGDTSSALFITSAGAVTGGGPSATRRRTSRSTAPGAEHV